MAGKLGVVELPHADARPAQAVHICATVLVSADHGGRCDTVQLGLAHWRDAEARVDEDLVLDGRPATVARPDRESGRDGGAALQTGEDQAPAISPELGRVIGDPLDRGGTVLEIVTRAADRRQRQDARRRGQRSADALGLLHRVRLDQQNHDAGAAGRRPYELRGAAAQPQLRARCARATAHARASSISRMKIPACCRASAASGRNDQNTWKTCVSAG